MSATTSFTFLPSKGNLALACKKDNNGVQTVQKAKAKTESNPSENGSNKPETRWENNISNFFIKK